MIKIPKDQPIQVLSIGTKILLKDVMDQYLRSLGEVKTFYAYKMSTALESFLEKRPQIIFCEQNFPEGSALELIQAIGGLHPSGDHYFVLAAEASEEPLVALAVEKGIDEILVKPFSTDNIHQIVERYFEKKSLFGESWLKDMRVAKQSLQEKRFQEAEELIAAASRKYSDNSSVLLECADFFLRRNYANQAKPLLERVLKDSPEHVNALHLMGVTLKKEGSYQAAAEYFLRASAMSPLNSLRSAELAETYLMMAEEQINAALKNENENSSLMLTKARYMLMRKDYAGLVTYLDAKRTFLSDAAKKEADFLSVVGKKMGGIR